jgi:CRP-like cAMP-binding protein/cytochrome P450
VGNALDLLLRPVNYFVDAAHEHGPVFRGTVLGRPTYFVVASRGRDLFDSAPGQGCPLSRSGMFDALSTETYVDVFGLDGAEHEVTRRLLAVGYSRIVAAQFVPEMIDGTRREVRAWRSGDKGSMVALGGELALRNVMRVLSPAPLDKLVSASALTGNMVMGVTMGLTPSWTLKFPRYRLARRRMIKQVDAVIARHKAGAFAEAPQTWMVDALLGARGPDGARLDDVGVRGAVLYSLCGSYMYLSRLVAFVVYHLLRDRALLDRVLAEVDTAMAGGSPNGQDLRRLPLLRASLREALRLYPPVPAISMTTTREVVVEGITVPAGANIGFTPIPDHYNPAYFEHPFDFDPERWFPERRRPRPPGSFGAFGLKSQTCAAAGMVEVVTMSTLIGLLYERELSLRRASYRPRLMLNPLMGPLGGLPVGIGNRREDSTRRIRPDRLVQVDLEAWTDEEPDLLDDQELSVVAHPEGVDIVTEGEPADSFFVIVEGQMQVLVGSKAVAELGRGQSFGEVGLLTSRPRNATVRSTSPVTLLRVERPAFVALVAASDLLGPELGGRLYRRHIDRTLRGALPGLAAQLRKAGLDDFDVIGAEPGEVIIRQGEPPDAFYVLVVGSAEVQALDRNGQNRKIADLAAGATFGEIGVIENRPRSATVRITGQQPALLLRMGRDRFLEALNGSPAMLRDLSTLARQRLMDNLDALYST